MSLHAFSMLKKERKKMVTFISLDNDRTTVTLYLVFDVKLTGIIINDNCRDTSEIVFILFVEMFNTNDHVLCQKVNTHGNIQ